MSTESKTMAHINGADQREQPDDVGQHHSETRPSHEQGQDNSHLNTDAKDQKSIANKLEQAALQEKREKEEENKPAPPPTAAARANGNEPSRGAKIDEMIQLEEEAELRKKGIIE